MRKFIPTLILVLLIATEASVFAEDKQEKTRVAIDAMEKDVLERFFTEEEEGEELFEQSYGYAVFNNIKMALLLTSSRGKGVAVNKESGKRTYMKMGSLGVNIGYGLQKMQVLFLFQTKEAYENFIDKGWRADAAADVALIKKGEVIDVEFRNGIFVYQFTEKGLMLQANLSGTKYYPSKKLNKGVEEEISPAPEKESP